MQRKWRPMASIRMRMGTLLTRAFRPPYSRPPLPPPLLPLPPARATAPQRPRYKTTAERDLARRGGAMPPSKKARASAPAPAPAAEDEEDENDIWACCERCGKWRILPPGIPEPNDEELWYCEAIGMSCEKGEDSYKGSWRHTDAEVKARGEAAKAEAAKEGLQLEWLKKSAPAPSSTPAPAPAAPGESLKRSQLIECRDRYRQGQSDYQKTIQRS